MKGYLELRYHLTQEFIKHLHFSAPSFSLMVTLLSDFMQEIKIWPAVPRPTVFWVRVHVCVYVCVGVGWRKNTSHLRSLSTWSRIYSDGNKHVYVSTPEAITVNRDWDYVNRPAWVTCSERRGAVVVQRCEGVLTEDRCIGVHGTPAGQGHPREAKQWGFCIIYL